MFLIYDADEFTLKYMEDSSTPSTFPYANASFVHERFGAIVLRQERGEREEAEEDVQSALSQLCDGDGNLRADELFDDLKGLRMPLEEHELLTIARFWKEVGNER